LRGRLLGGYMRLRFLAPASLVLLVCLLLAARPARADWPPIAPEELAMTSVPQQPGAPAVILLRQENDDDLKHFHHSYFRIKVLTEAGRRYADVELPYVRGQAHFTIDSISGRTVHPDGTVIPFEGKPFDKVITKSRGVRYSVKAFTLPAVEPGSILDYKYSLRYEDRYFVAPEWVVQRDLFQKRAEFTFIPYLGALVLAHGRVGGGLNWSNHVPPPFKIEHHELPQYFVTLAVTDVPALVDEPNMPPEDMLRWRVDFYYQADSPADFWKDESKRWTKDVESFLGKRNGVSEKLGTVTAPADTPEQKLKKIYAFVQGLENQSYIPARQKQETDTLGLKPNEGVEDVLSQHSGTHDELNRLFAEMARESGFTVNMIMVPSRDERFFDESLLNMRQFDAEIVEVQAGGKDLYFDPGSKFCPYGLLDWRYSGSKGMREGGGKAPDFVEVPLPTYNDAMIKRVAKVKLGDDGAVSGLLGVGFFGIEGMIRRQQGGRTDAEGRKKLLEDEVKGWLPGGSEVTLTATPLWDETEKPMVAQFKISCPAAVSAGKKVVMATHIFQSGEKPMFSAAQRINPVYLYYPSRQIDDIQITLPPSMDVDSLPAPRKIQLDYAMYTAEDKKQGNVIVTQRDLAMAGMAFPVAEYGNVKGFYEKVKAGDDDQVILKGVAHAGN